MRRAAWLAVLLAALVVLPAPATAQKVALVVGNGAYTHAPALPNPPNDARGVATALRDLGFEVLEGVDLDKPATDQLLRRFAERLDDADVGLFYYAGHGLQVYGQNYMVPVDAELDEAKDLHFEAIDLQVILRLLEDDAARTNLVFLDACRDNPLARNLARSMGASRSQAIGRGLAPIEGGLGTLIAYATQPGNVALDGTGEHSPFTAALIEHLATPGLEVRSLLSRVRRDVIEATGRQQVPWDHSSLTGDFYFLPEQEEGPPPDREPTPRPAPGSQETETAFWDTIKGEADPAYFEEYLRLVEEGRFTGIFAGLARIRLKALEPEPAPEPSAETAVAAAPDIEGEPSTKETGRVARSWLGVRTQAVTGEIAEMLGLPALPIEGALVASITPGGPAEESSLQPGDVILKFGGEDVDTWDTLTRIVAETPIGTEVEVVVWRNGERRTLDVTTGGRPEEPALAASASAVPGPGLEPDRAPAVVDPAAVEAAMGLIGAEWREVQRGLAALGYVPGPADGAPGPRTRAALRAWQRAWGEGATGYLSPGQAAALIAAAPAVDVAVGVFPGADVVTPGRRRPEPFAVFRDCAECPEMVVVPGGMFLMGSPRDEAGRDDDEGPRHEVEVAPFALGKYEVTFAQWDACEEAGACSGEPPPEVRGWGQGGRWPVVEVSWEQAQDYVAWLSGKTGADYRLPSEAEWEYAARAGTATPFWTGGTISTAQANYHGSYTYGSGQQGAYRGRATPVDAFAANPWGLHDVHGNVWEWVQDCYHSSYTDAPTDSSARDEEGCTARVVRGGSWNSQPRLLRSAARIRNGPDFRNFILGFRVARALAP